MVRFVDTGTRIMLLEDYKREQRDNEDRRRLEGMYRANREWLEAVRGKERDQYGDIIESEV